MDEGVHWTGRDNGLPAGPIDGWLRGDGILFVSFRQGGIYLSQDEALNRARVDADTERGRGTGLVQIGQGIVILGSQSEGVLELDLRSMK